MSYCKMILGHAEDVYGFGVLDGTANPGEVVKITANDTFATQTDGTIPSFGILLNNMKETRTDYTYDDGDKARICYREAILETDNFTAGMAVDDPLTFDTGTGKIVKWTTGKGVCGWCISVTATVLKFKFMADGPNTME